MSDEPWRKYPDNAAEVVATRFLHHAFQAPNAPIAWAFLGPTMRRRIADLHRTASADCRGGSVDLAAFALEQIRREHAALVGARFGLASHREVGGDLAAIRFEQGTAAVLVTLEVAQDAEPLPDEDASGAAWRVEGLT